MKNVRKKRHFPYLKIILALIFIIILATGILLYLYPVKYMNIIEKYSKKYNLRPEFVCAIINTESKFDAKQVSPKNAKGLMQIMETTANWVNAVEPIENYDYENICDPELNVNIGCWYISWLNKRYNNNKKLVLAAYNAGSGNITKWLANEEYSKDGKTLSVIPFKETSDYVKKVLYAEKLYKYILKLPFI